MMPPVLTLTQEQFESYDVRSLENPPGYSGAALTCRVCGGMIVADEGLRIDVVLELFTRGGGLAGHSENSTGVSTSSQSEASTSSRSVPRRARARTAPG